MLVDHSGDAAHARANACLKLCKSPEERARVLQDLRDVEPLLCRVAHHEVQTTASVDAVLRTLLALVDAACPAVYGGPSAPS